MADIDFFTYKQFEKTFSNAKAFVNKECPYDCDTSGQCPFNICETLVPCAEEAPYIECVYDVVANRDSGGTIVSYPSIRLYYVNPCNAFSMKVDDKPAQALSAYYTFDSEGEHVVRFYSRNKITTTTYEAFGNCPNLVTLRHIDDMTAFARRTFYKCGIKYLEIPSGVTTIPYEFAYDAKRFKEIIIPKTITGIDGFSFRGTTGTDFMKVYSERPPTLISNNQFTGASWPIYVPADSVNAYKSAWGSVYASRIKPM